MKRIVLFAATNLAVVVLLGFVARLLGVDRYLYQSGLNLPSLLAFAAIFGMGGSLISLLMSKSIAKMSVGAQVIENPSNQTERWLVDTVQRQAQAAGIGMPEVAVYNSPKWRFTTRPNPMPSPPGPTAMRRWWRSAPVFCNKCPPRKRKRCSATKSAMSPTAIW